MIIAVDFDNTIVAARHPYDDLKTPLQFLPGAKEGLLALKNADHVLLLWSARSSLCLRVDWRLNPLWASGTVPLDVDAWQENVALEEARYQQMLDFVAKELPGVFDAVDNGCMGKPIVDLFIDDKAVQSVGILGMNWQTIARTYGEI
jgi:hypothetical protein